MILGTISWLIRCLPLPWAMALATLLGRIWYYGIPIRRKVALRHVACALGPAISPARRRQIVRRSFENLVKFAVEGLRSPSLNAQVSQQTVRRENFAEMDRLLAGGKGVVAVTAHIGNFELLGTSQTVRGYRINAILKDIANPAVARFWSWARRRTGLGHIAPRASKDAIVAALGRNEIVAFLIDQHMAPYRSIVCTFFGMLAATTYAPVRFAMQTGAPILPLFIVREGKPGHHVIRMLPEFVLTFPHATAEENVAHNTQRLNQLVEQWVRAYPEQWLWVHKRWKVQDNPQGWVIAPHLSHLVGTAPSPNALAE
jgi:KDO2-lipid IV(A) lauroyltransferase